MPRREHEPTCGLVVSGSRSDLNDAPRWLISWSTLSRSRRVVVQSYADAAGVARSSTGVDGDAIVDGPSPVIDLRTLAHRNSALRL